MESDEMSNLSLMIADCDHQIKKLIKLHERLANKNQQLSLHGAAKLLKSYENVLQCSQNLYSEEARLFEILESSRPPENITDNEKFAFNEDSKEPESILYPPQGDRHSSRKEIVGDDSDFIEEVIIESGPEVDSTECLFSPETSSIVVENIQSQESHESPTKKSKISDPVSAEIEQESMEKNPFSDLAPGTELAAFCKINGEKKPGEWILARYLGQVEADLFQVEDAEDAQPEESVKRSKKSSRLKYSVSLNELIIFDKKVSASIKSRDRIFALFPSTTCFYPATVLNTNQKRKKNELVVRFADDSATSRVVPSKYIFRCDAVNSK